MLHIPARESQDPYAAVAVKFETQRGEVSVARRWNFYRQGKIRDLNSRDGEEVRTTIGGRPRTYQSWQDANSHIAEILFPANVMPCLFFDGEQAQVRVEETGERALLDAVNALYGTGVLSELSRSLRTFIQNESINLKKDVGVVKEDELDLKRRDLDRIKDQQIAVGKELLEKRKRRDTIDSDRETAASEIYQLVGDSAADVEEYTQTVRALEEERNELRQKLSSAISSLALPLAASRLGMTAQGRVKAERERDKWLLLREEAMAKAIQIVENVFPSDASASVDPPLTVGQTAQLRQRLEKALQSLWSPPPEGCADEFRFVFLSSSDRVAVLSKLERVRTLTLANVAELASRWNAVSASLREADRRLQTIKALQPRLSELKQKVQEATKKIQDIDGEIGGLVNQEIALGSQLKELRGAIGQMEKKQTAAGPVQRKLDAAHRIREAIDDATQRLMPLCQQSLEERCTHHFQNMISREFKGFVAKFDQDQEPRLENEAGQVRYVTTGLSGAQKRAFGLAFTLAVADLSGQPAPLIIDTPVGNMDSEYRQRVLEYVAEAAPGQVIFLTHDEEISEDYYRRLKSRIAKTFTVEFEPVQDGAGISTPIENSYFGARTDERVQSHAY
jgi:DNA sulfur modification protein DndD